MIYLILFKISVNIYYIILVKDFCVMTFRRFAEKHYENILRVVVALTLGLIVGAFIWAFSSGVLPHQEDGDAFDTIYAIEESQES